MATHAFPVHHSNANVVAPQGLLCMSRSSCLPSYTPCDDDSLEPVTSSLIVHPFWLGDAVIPMQPSGMLLLSIHAPYYWAIGCIPYSVAVQDSPSSFFFLPPMSMMLLLHNHCWHGPSISTTSAPASSVLTQRIGDCASSPGFTSFCKLPLLFPGIPNGKRTVPACLLPGPKRNWASGAGSNVFSGASSCSF